MKRSLRLIGSLLACGLCQLRAQNIVFDASFSGDAINPATYPAVTASSTGWDILSNKNTPASTESGGVLTLNMAGTTSGFFEAQALFSPQPVELLPGTYIELTATFSPTYILTNPSDNLIFGFFNSGGSAPLSGLQSSGLSNSLTTFATGGAKGWMGYNANIPLTGSNPRMLTRPAQTGSTNTVQDVLVDSQSGSVGYSTPAGVSASSISAMSTTLTNTLVYTLDYKLSLSADGLTLLGSVSLFNGPDTTGTLVGSYTGKFTGATLITKSFDALAIGWRADAGGSNPSNLKLSALTVSTTGGAPWIPVQPPSSVAVSIGGELNLSATVNGVVDSLQWQVSTDGGSSYNNLDSSANPSAATASLTIGDVQFSHAGSYRLVATNAAGSTTSSSCAVSVSATPVAPSFSVNPAGGTVFGGTSFSFSAVVNGTSPLSFQWEKSTDGSVYAPIDGATALTYTLATVAVSDQGYYRLVVTNSAGSATSSPAHLIVNEPLAIVSQPAGATLHLGDSYTLSVTATGTPAPTYQWRKNGVAIPGATSSSYTIGSATGADTASYTVVANNATGSITSDPATIAVLSPTMTAVSLTPSGSGTRNPDARLEMTFSEAPTVGNFGLVQIHDADTDAVVDTIDLAAATAQRDTLRAANSLATLPLPVQTKTIGGITNFHYYPVTVSGNTVALHPRSGTLAYGKTYYVTVDAGAFVNAAGEAFAGFADTHAWRFSTKASGLLPGATRLTVAADGTGDFDTVQGAIDYVPANNTTPTVIRVKNGTYFEEIAFQAKHNLTVVGEDRVQTEIVYPNNATFNSAGGVYHRGTFLANSVHDFTLANLTVRNSTPQNGSQAEALIVSGTSATSAHNIVTNCRFFSYQDTVQFNKQTYVSGCTIEGDVDFMWGDGPTFLENCDIRILRSAAYFTQIRNGSGNHGYVFVNCRFTAPVGIGGTFLGRIDPASFPYSEVVVLDSRVGDNANPSVLATASGPSGSNYLGGWWLLNNATSASAAPQVHNWANAIVDANGTALANPNSDAFTTMPTDAETQAHYRDATWVLNTNLAGTANGSWVPSLAPVILVQPVSQSVDLNASATFSVSALAVPSASYQWRRNGVDIAGANGPSLTLAAVSASDADTYSVLVSNSAGSVVSDTVTLLVNGGPPVITQHPVSQSAFAGSSVTLSVFAIGNGPMSFQWFKDGSPLAGATGQTLRLGGLQAGDAGAYTVTVTNGNGSDTSQPAVVSLVAPAAGQTPVLPTIPDVVFNVTNYGAVGDGATDNTGAINAALAAAKAAGGGIVELPPAAAPYLSGPILISSNTNLQIDGGATLKMLPFGTYPNPTTHFVTFASSASNVALTGNGIIDGDGAPWWAAYDAGLITARPRLVQFNKASNVLVMGVTLRNSPNFNLAFSGSNSNVTILGVSILAPGDSPNTDGMDLAGTNFLVQNCYVSVGDDNVVAKPGSAFCQNIVVADCSFGTGHGVSIGGQTNVGLDGMLVTNCTFDGTSTALRMKADPTQGGPVQNVTYSNLTMKNVQYPILFYSYYNQLGSPGATSGSSQTTPAKVNTWNATPPNSLASSTLPTWKNITIKNLTVENASGYCTIWGLPLAQGLIANVTLENVTISGGAGLELFDAANIQLSGVTSVGPILTCNALAITGQPEGRTINVGETVVFTASAVGGSGTNNTGLSYQWKRDGAVLSDGVQPDGSVVSGATTASLTITNAKVAEAGSYTVTVGTTLDGYDVASSSLAPNSLPVSATSSAAGLVVKPTAGAIVLSDLTQMYDGTPKVPTATTDPAGLAVTFAFAGGVTPVNAGAYPVTATFSDPNYSGSATGTLTIQPAAASIVLGDLAQVYSGTPRPVSVTTTPAGLPVAVTYDGAETAPVNAGSYAVLATITDSNYLGNETQTLVVSRAAPSITVTPYAVTYDGAPHAATGSAVGVQGESLSGLDLSATVHTDAGSYSDAWVFTDGTGNYTHAAGTIVDSIGKAPAQIALSPLTQRYDGLPKPVAAQTTPSGLNVALTYDGLPDAPIYPGAHSVVATVDDPNHSGSATETLTITISALVRHAPTLNGLLDGSVQMLSPEYATLNGGASVSGDLLVPGMPKLQVNGHPTFVGTKDAAGAAAPTNYTITLNGGAVLRYAVRRVDAIPLPTVPAPSAPTGSRSVTLNRSTDSPGDFATLRDLTLNGNAGSLAVPPGNYGSFAVNGSSSLVLGVAQATEPAVYSLQNLLLNGKASLKVVGPVVLTVGNTVNLNGRLGDPAHPEWLSLQVYSGGVTVNGGGEIDGSVVAPTGSVTVNGVIRGSVIADRLTVNGNAVLDDTP